MSTLEGPSPRATAIVSWTPTTTWLSHRPALCEEPGTGRACKAPVADLDAAGEAVISGSSMIGDCFLPEVTLGVRVVTPTEVRIERLRQREYARFGERIREGGDMYGEHLEFIQWAGATITDGPAARSKQGHDWHEQGLCCPWSSWTAQSLWRKFWRSSTNWNHFEKETDMKDISIWMEEERKAARSFRRAASLSGLAGGSFGRERPPQKGDIDVMTAVENLSIADLDAYRYYGNHGVKAGGLAALSAAWEELQKLAPVRAVSGYGDTRTCNGELKAILPAFSDEDVRDFVRINAANLYHELTHRYLL